MSQPWHEWRWPGPAGFAPPLDPLRRRLETAAPASGQVRVAKPGTALFTGDPVWQATGPEPILAEVAAAAAAEGLAGPETVGAAAQVYRMLDAAGRFEGDTVRLLEDDPLSGQLLLADAWRAGRWHLADDLDRSREGCRHRQGAAMPPEPQDYPVADERAADEPPDRRISR